MSDRVTRPRRGLLVAYISMCLCAAPSVAAPISIGQSAPDFTLKRGDKINVRLKDLRGHPILLQFWNRKCVPCRAQVAALNRLDKDGVTVWGVGTDDPSDKGQAWSAEWGMNYPVVWDTTQRVTFQYGIESVPTLVLIDKDGKVRYLRIGDADMAELEAQIGIVTAEWREIR